MTAIHRRATAEDVAEAKVVPVRLPELTLARIRAQQARLHQQTGLTVNVSQVIKMLIDRGLAVVEAEATPPKKR